MVNERRGSFTDCSYFIYLKLSDLMFVNTVPELSFPTSCKNWTLAASGFPVNFRQSQNRKDPTLAASGLSKSYLKIQYQTFGFIINKTCPPNILVYYPYLTIREK